MFAPRAGPPLALGAVGLVVLGSVALLYGALHRPEVAVPLAGATLAWAFLAAFFRDPDRPVGEGIVAPADGRILAVDREGDRVRVATFMGVTNVHVNRFPLDARVAAVETLGEGHRPAYRSDARHNRQRSYALETAAGPVEVVQMTGVVARRLVSLVGPGDARRKGDRLGLIVLGSRVDLLLPADRVTVVVRPGDRVRAGATTVARESL